MIIEIASGKHKLVIDSIAGGRATQWFVDDLQILVSKMLGSSFFMLNHYLKESIKANQALLSKAIYGINEEEDNRVTVKMISDMVVRRAKLRELSSEVLKSEI